MSVLPVDLQVLFSKASEHSENIARQSNSNHIISVEGYEKIHKQSKETDEKVSNLDEYSQDFTKINPEGKRKEEQARKRKKKLKENEEDTEDNKRAPMEEGKGGIIDIID
jgi:uncharacterized coiled-coil DUF342 family protein